VPKPIATWNSARGVWEVPGGASHLCGHSELYSGTWPTSGTWDLGSAYEPRTWERPIPASAPSSSPGPQTVHRELAGGRLLKTPTSQLAVNGGSQHPDKRKAGGHGPTLADEVEHLLPTPTAAPYGNNQSPSLDSLAPTLLPTPRTSDTNGTGKHGTGGPNLRTAISLLPTPRATDGEKGGPNQRGSSGDLMLPSAVAQLLSTPRASDGGPRGSSAGWGLRNEVRQLLPTPDATHGRKTTRTEPLLPGVVETLLPTPKASDADRGDCPSERLRRSPVLESAVKLLPTPMSTRPGTTANFRPDGTPYGEGYGPTLLGAARMLPTPMAADGEGASLAMPRGNPTLAGAVDSLGRTPTTPKRSRAGKRSSDAPHPGQLTITDA
jgi:hypothetical protein